MSRWLAALFAVGLGACASENRDDYGGVLDLSAIADGGLTSQFTPGIGYVGSKKMEYYDFGETRGEVNKDNKTIGAPTAYMYWFYDQDTGAPLFRLKIDPNTQQLAKDD